MKNRLAWTGWILFLFLIVSQVSSQRIPTPAVKPGDSWEYKYFQPVDNRGGYTDSFNITEMNKLGAEGWEIAVHQPEKGVFIFKRRK